LDKYKLQFNNGYASQKSSAMIGGNLFRGIIMEIIWMSHWYIQHEYKNRFEIC